MKRLVRTRTRKLVLLATVLALVAAGTAIAFWIASGTGTASGSNASLSPLTISQGAGSTTPSAKKCFPGGTCNAVVDVTNPAANPQLEAYQFTITGSPPITGDANCADANYTTTQTAGQPVAITPAVPLQPGQKVAVQLQDAVTLSNLAPTSCQGAGWRILSVKIDARTP